MNDLKVFSNTEFGELGVMIIDGKEYFPATQCAKILGYVKPADAVRVHCKGVFKTQTPTNGGEQTVNYIPEGDLYRLIVKSKLPQAEKFERWVFDEVLPAIRKNGTYGNINLEDIIAKTATAVVSEVFKQLTPLMAEKAAVPVNVPKYKKPRRAAGIIAKLDSELQRTVDEMLLSDKFSYEEISKFLAEYGVAISITSVWRYNKKLHNPVIIEEI